jgi:hypothetical protein
MKREAASLTLVHWLLLSLLVLSASQVRAPRSYPLNWEWWWSKMRVYGNGTRTLPH